MAPLSSAEVDYRTSAYLRIVAISIAVYDCAQTYPRVIRFYREQLSTGRIMISLVLFALLRFFSVVALLFSNVSFFSTNFTQETCQKFFMLPALTKVLQAMVSQAILGLRAYNLSQRSKLVGRAGIFAYFVACTLQFVASFYQRTPVVGPTGNCIAQNSVKIFGAYIFYVVAMMYDLTTSAVCIYYLLKFKLNMPNKTMLSKVTTMMLRDGIGYFMLLSAVNSFNLVWYRNAQTVQTAGSSLAYATTWIMSQRLLLHVHDAALDRRNESVAAVVTVTQNINTGRDLTQAVRSQFERRKDMSTAFDLTVPDFDMSYQGGVEIPENNGVHVRIERTVKLEPTARFELEDYTRKRPTQQYSWHRGPV